jgi:hypothetical protein
MRHIALALFSILCTSAFSKPSITNRYEYSEIGLSFSYPQSWVIASQAMIDQSHEYLRNNKMASSKQFEDIKKFAPLYTLRLVKPQTVDGAGNNPNASVLVAPIPDKWETTEELKKGIASAIPGAELTPNRLPIPNQPDIQNFLLTIPMPKGVSKQYHYIYQKPPYHVHIMFCFDDAVSETEVKEMVKSLKIK